ncbi:MAG: transcriptional repressor LexA [Verrucomicrobia bacterium]|nr:transcriptional repressor LexA [Verrucomicrobiota bacterium]
MRPITERQREILAFIEETIRLRALAPTIREICDHFGFASPRAAQEHLRTLVRKGLITKEPGKARALRVLHPSDGIPIVGDVAAGTPIMAIENARGNLDFKDLFGAGELFAVLVHGESMTGCGILDGDYVIVRSQPTVEDGAIAVAYLDGEATVKRFRRTRGGYCLQPENPAYPPIIVRESNTDFRLAGPVVGVIRQAKGGFR